MKLSEIKIQLKALNGYVQQFIEKLNSLDNTSIENEDGSREYSEREDYFIEHYYEASKIWKRYSKIRNELKNLFPDFFTDLMDIGIDKIKHLEELSREFPFILEVLEGIENQSASSDDFFSFADGTSTDNSPFSEAEQKRIAQQLEEVRNQLIKIATEQTEPEEIIESNVEKINTNLGTLLERSSKIGRKDWSLYFLATITSIVITLSSSGEARITLFTAIQNLLNYIYHSRLLIT